MYFPKLKPPPPPSCAHLTLSLPLLQTVVPSLLIPLSSPYELIRERALECLAALQEACTSGHPLPNQPPSTPTKTGHTPFYPPTLQLVQEIMNSKVDLLADSTHINFLLSKLHSSASSLIPPMPATPSKRRSRRLATGSEVGVSSVDVVPGSEGWLECVLTHIVSLGMPVYVQTQFLRVLDKVDHVVSA